MTRTVKMIQKRLILAFFLSVSASTAFSNSTPYLDVAETPPISAQKLEKIFLTKEEKYYIYSECKQFAKDDEIEDEFINDYIGVCSIELTKAVKTAKYRLENKSSARTIPTRVNKPTRTTPI